jgi:hypothetical protein
VKFNRLILLCSFTYNELEDMSITIEIIWNLKNRVVHNGDKINLAVAIKGTEFRFVECTEARDPVVDKDPKIY